MKPEYSIAPERTLCCDLLRPCGFILTTGKDELQHDSGSESNLLGVSWFNSQGDNLFGSEKAETTFGLNPEASKFTPNDSVFSYAVDT